MTIEVPNFITAKSLTGLRRFMIENNVKKKITFKYFDIQQSKNSRGQLEWVAFYYENLNNADIIQQQIK